ncbi:PEP-CTERM sorting domain-containing protein [Stieleria sp. TO1_6]|uniref:PEP-CTERM sorting domain-containing protein n=1 Tax=Stieleria tagensis TaxID=2956795 RepID=UPI00209B0C37|nr:PEP-CTERM sorting domain-containing protein [Stieleria tagensis]MCO8125086.1 PEP-CTERM sorting domain-containing protein [Stieleria tagensis]
MKIQLRRSAIYAVLTLICWGLCTTDHSVSAGVLTITTPPGDGVSGNGQSERPFTNAGDANGNRYQQVYSSDLFSGVGALQSISSVAFRPKQGAFGNIINGSVTLRGLTINLSTTPRDANTDFPNGISSDLALNVGADSQTVFSGDITLTTDRRFGDTDVEDFDFYIPFTQSFLYQPGQGNLLLEVIVAARSDAVSSRFTQLDQFTDGFPSRDGTASANDSNLLNDNDPFGTVGSNSTTGAVTQFETQAVPEPSSMAILLGIALTGGLASRRRTNRS